ncbi:hypothetical protein AU468_14290 [Alkalispirochaeta sphaeroplastigenens]|uniref:DUF192 domain-containing protein n=1 Tax=Alkalispirochaeta sphaeroplastigenens TaxID=1187066 RepID=A0A2S4JF95_9SPIO|nr:DUF192 domain-containing protein [Alkalispirochaeta sphaeroplastigenens]POQ98201.1 hypothetical protein AU468_14290 [Alkalispirochaeta sphaeroplastigenens]
MNPSRKNGKRRPGKGALLLLQAGFLLWGSLLSCSSGEPHRVALEVGGHTFQVELARTEEERARGLMFREELGPDEGMLFIFPDSAIRAFWMKNTPLPLSIAYISARGVILEIRHMEPFSLEPVQARHPLKFALEVNQGRFQELGILPGARVDLSPLGY